MSTQKHHHRLRRRNILITNGARFIVAAVFIFSLVFATNQASAGPVTNPGGNEPFAKVSVYQGVAGIVNRKDPANVNSPYQALELGSYGSDIATSSDLFIRTNGLAHDETKAAKFGANTYGTTLSVPGGITIGIGNNTFNSMLCFGDGGTDCRATWSGLGPYSLDQTLNIGGALAGVSSHSLTAGTLAATSSSAPALTTPSAKVGATVSGQQQAKLLVVGSGVVDDGNETGSPNDGLAVYVNSGDSAIMGQQNGVGYAGYFSGNVNVTNNLSVSGKLNVGGESIHKSCFISTTNLQAVSATSPSESVDVITAAPFSQNWSATAITYHGSATASNFTAPGGGSLVYGCTAAPSAANNCTTTAWRSTPVTCTLVDVAKTNCGGAASCSGQSCTAQATYVTSRFIAGYYCRGVDQ